MRITHGKVSIMHQIALLEFKNGYVNLPSVDGRKDKETDWQTGANTDKENIFTYILMPHNMIILYFRLLQ